MPERLLCAAIVAYCLQCKYTGLQPYISAVRNWHIQHGLGDLRRGHLFHDVKKGLINTFSLRNGPLPKRPIAIQDLRAFRRCLNLRSSTHIRFFAECLVAFFGLLRMSEHVGQAMRWKHIEFTPWGVILTIPFSKTNLRPVQIPLAARGDDLCPRQALLRLRDSTHSPKPSKPVFGWSRSTFVTILRKVISFSLNVDPTAYSGHSFRRGGTTALHMAGVSPTMIKIHGRWKSNCFERYIDMSVLQRISPTVALLHL